ncbi:MAG: glycosyltransferase family 2 protein, partial [Chitinivibrionales bacterium]
HITTLSGNIKDGLCGFRCYPLAPVVKLISKKKTGNRMEFDPEIIIRLYRNGTPAVNLPTQIRYIDNDPSHFNLLQDNLRISWMFFRFFWSTPLYLPKLIKLRKSKVNRDL